MKEKTTFLMNLPPKYTTSYNDYRSDTFTIPTPQLWSEISNASLGDSVYQEDTDTCYLENRVANEFVGNKLHGDEMAQGLFCMSTTMSNQLAIRSHLNFAPPYTVLCDKRAHIFVDECAGVAVLSQALVIPVQASNGHHLTLEDIKENYIPDIGDIHLAPTRLICLENTLHGMCFPYNELKRISDWCHNEGILLHLDGARLWNAVCAHNGTDKIGYMHKVCSLFDSISLCLSKSLGAPIGSVLVGKPEFIRRARHLQKQQGGGIRQAGFITRAANHCIDLNFPGNVSKVTDVTKRFWADLYTEIKENYGIELQLAHPVETNFIFIDLAASRIDMDKLLELGEKNNVKLFDGRLAFHYQNIDDKGLEQLKQVFIDLGEYYRDHEYVAGKKCARIY